MSLLSKSIRAVILVMGLFITGCNGGSSSVGMAGFAMSGSLSGLADNQNVTLIDLYNIANKINLSANGKFTFPNHIGDGAKYSVIVLNQPNNEVCSVNNGEGTGVNANVSDVTVVCSKDLYTISGSVTGLSPGQMVVLMNNGNFESDLVTMQYNQNFTFNQPVAFDGSYNVTIYTPATNETCSVNNGSGANVNSNITNVQVVCSKDSYTISGTVSGLKTGQSFTLVNNGNIRNPGDTIKVSSDGKFTFGQKIALGGSYNIKVKPQPLNEGCSLVNGNESNVSSNITNVQVTCAAGYLSTLGIVASGNQPGSLAITPDGKHVYVVNSGDNNVSMYNVDENGRLDPMSTATIAAESGAQSIIVSSDGKHVYVLNNGASTVSRAPNTISIYTIDSNGLLQHNSPASIATVNYPTALTMTPNGNYLYVTGRTPGDSDPDGLIAMYSVNSDGNLTPISNPIVSPDPMPIDIKTNGKYVYVLDWIFQSINTYNIGNDGNLEIESNAAIATGNNPRSLIISPNDVSVYAANAVYVANANDNTISIYGGEGILWPQSPNPTVATGNYPSALAITPDAYYTYATNAGDDSISMYSSQYGNFEGLLSLFPVAIPTGNNPGGIAVDNNYAYVTNSSDGTVSMYKILR